MNASGKAAIVIGAVAAGAFVLFYVADSGDSGPGEAITCGLTTAAAIRLVSFGRNEPVPGASPVSHLPQKATCAAAREIRGSDAGRCGV